MVNYTAIIMTTQQRNPLLPKQFWGHIFRSELAIFQYRFKISFTFYSNLFSINFQNKACTCQLYWILIHKKDT